jgi:hypothetical protein
MVHVMSVHPEKTGIAPGAASHASLFPGELASLASRLADLA